MVVALIVVLKTTCAKFVESTQTGIRKLIHLFVKGARNAFVAARMMETSSSRGMQKRIHQNTVKRFANRATKKKKKLARTASQRSSSDVVRADATLAPHSRKERIMFASEGKEIHVVAYGNGYGCEVHVGEYSNGNTAVTLVAETRDEDGVFSEPLCCLSVNFGDALPSGHFYLKNWSENEAVVENDSVKELMTQCEEHAPFFSGYVVSHCYVLK